MNIIEAVGKALEGYAIMNTERNEWIICSGGALRWKSNRQPANLNVKDILSMKWISEEELITISKIQIEEALGDLELSIDNDGRPFIKSISKFFEKIQHASHTNKLRMNGEIND